MLGRLKKLKDSSGNYVYPITVSESVFMEDGTTTLKTKISEMDQAISQVGSGGNSTTSYITGKTINCIGDSLVAGTTGGATPWATFLQNDYNCTVRNYGVSGSPLSKNPNNTYSAVERYSSMDSNADIVLVWAGWNDINQGLPLGTFEDRVNTSFYGALHLMADGLMSKYVGKKIFFCTILDLHHNWSTVQNYNKAIREVTEYYALPILDTSRIGFSSRNADQKIALMPDNIHPNTDGNKIIADVFAKFINSH